MKGGDVNFFSSEFQTPRGNYLHCNLRDLTPARTVQSVSNPSRELPALQRGRLGFASGGLEASFKPLAGITCIATGNPRKMENCPALKVSNPSRELPALQLSLLPSGDGIRAVRFKPLAGITCIATKEEQMRVRDLEVGFKPLAGITCIATRHR